MARCRYPAVLDGRQYGAALFLDMCAVRKPAHIDIGAKLDKQLLDRLFIGQLHHFRIEGGKSGRIRDDGAIFKPVELDMARRMPASAQLDADVADRYIEAGSSMFRMLDFPTPELPVKALTFP
jgi:hypothetical protein